MKSLGAWTWSIKSTLLTLYQDCPCELNCSNGCEDCPNPVCECQVCSFCISVWLQDNFITYIKVVEENPDWNRCTDDNSLKLGRCVHACNDNKECEDDCLSRFKSRQINCPCEVSWGHSQLCLTKNSGKLFCWLPLQRIWLYRNNINTRSNHCNSSTNHNHANWKRRSCFEY